MRTRFEPEGDLASVDILAGLVALWREAGSGVLRAEHPASSARFDLADGEVVGVTSSDSRFDTAAILVRAGKLDAASLDRLVAPEGSDRALAALAAGILTKREWRWGEKIRAIEVLSDLLMWANGSYTFDSVARPLAQELRIPIPRLLLELFLRSRDRNLIDHQLGASDVPLVRSENFEQEFSGFGLTADAESVVRLIDGRATAAGIAEKAPADEFAVQKLLAALMTLGLVRPDFAAEEPAAAPIRGGEEWRESGRLTPLDFRGESSEAGSEQFPEPLRASPEEPEATDFSDFPPSVAEEPLSEAAESEDRDRAFPARESPIGGWEPLPPEPLDRTLEIPVSPPEASRSKGRGLLFASLAAILVAGVAAFLLLRPFKPGSPPPAVAPPTEATPSPIAAEDLTPGPIGLAPPSPVPQGLEPSPVPTPPAALPTPSERPPASRTPVEGERRKWLERAERDRKRLQSERRTAYAIQLELACEVPTLEKAWTYDRPAGSLWLLTSPHGGRTCFKVLWGRYGSLEAARRAKSGIPSFFTTGGNRPAVVAVR